MPLVTSVDPHDKTALRRRIAEFHSIFDLLERLEREARELSNSYDRAERWLRAQGPDFEELTSKLHSFRIATRYQHRRLSAIAEQVNGNWDMAMNLSSIVFHDASDPSPLEFGFPVDVIGDPPAYDEHGEISDE